MASTNSWVKLGLLSEETTDFSDYRKDIGLYRAILDEEIVYIGKATELHNGGFCKRLRDYTRNSDSSRDYPTGRMMFQHKDKLQIEILIFERKDELVPDINALEKQLIKQHKPKWNVQLSNRKNRKPNMLEKTMVLIALLYFCTISNVSMSIVDARALEAITLQGTPFDIPNSKDDIIKKCLSSVSNLVPEFIKRHSLCEESSFRVREEHTTIYLATYGNIRIDDNHVLQATIDRRNDSLVQVFVRGSTIEMLGLASLLSDKYGKPLVKTTFVQNQLGREFEKKTFEWSDHLGTQITVESIFDKINDGALFIKSAAFLKNEREEELQQIERFNELKGNL